MGREMCCGVPRSAVHGVVRCAHPSLRLLPLPACSRALPVRLCLCVCFPADTSGMSETHQELIASSYLDPADVAEMLKQAKQGAEKQEQEQRKGECWLCVGGGCRVLRLRVQCSACLSAAGRASIPSAASFSKTSALSLS